MQNKQSLLLRNQIPKNPPVPRLRRAGWQKVKLGEVLKIRRGASPRPIHEYITSEGMPWLKIADVTSTGSRYVDFTKEFIKQEGVSKSVVVKPGDLILSNSATPGIPRFMRITACVHDGWLILEPRDNSIDKDYLYYRLTIDRQKLISNVTGAIFDNLKTDTLRDHEVFLPSINEQKAISAILSAFDDKIEANNKIAKTLEEMAQAFFKEWFKDYNDSNWETKNLFDVAEVTYGYPFKSELFNDAKNGIPVIRIRNLEESSTDTFTTETVNERYIVKNGDILVGMDGEFYIRKWSGGKSYLNQRVVRLRPKEDTSWFHLLLSISKPIRDFQASISGTTVAHLSDKDLKSIKVTIPPYKVYEGFKTKLDSLYWLSIKLSEENQKLAALRDLLLPKLMKGEIRV